MDGQSHVAWSRRIVLRIVTGLVVGTCIVLVATVGIPVVFGLAVDEDTSAQSLTSEQVERAKAVALGDERVKAVIAGQQYAWGDVVPWVTSEDVLLGVDVTVTLDKPVALDDQAWPALGYDTPDCDPGRTSYAVATIVLTATNVDSIRVRVDLRPSEVAQIRPGLDATVVSSRLVLPSDGVWYTRGD